VINKTWRGLVGGALVAGLSALLIGWLVPRNHCQRHGVCDWAYFSARGRSSGTAWESIAKRQLGVARGEKWFPWDQIDYIIGGLLFVLMVADLPLWAIVTIIIAYFPLHLLFAYIGYLLGLKSTPI
jgi:CDP-diglyceride synthetase